MILNRPLIAVIITAATLFSCKKENGSNSGGKGGNAVLRVTARHHTRVIDTGKVFIKYKSMDYAIPFDDSAVIVSDTGGSAALFTNLTTGHYYLYGSGWDSLINDDVVGGLPFEVTEERLHNISLPVTEGD